MKKLLYLMLMLMVYLNLKATNVPCCDCNKDGEETVEECEFDSDNDGKFDTCLSVDILTVSLPKDKIRIRLSPSGARATLTAFLIKEDGTQVIIKSIPSQQGGTFDAVSWRKYTTDNTTYTAVKIKWGNYATAQYSYKFRRLSAYRHTQYTTPKENNNTCKSGENINVYLTDSFCSATASTFKKTFYDEVLENGSGISVNNVSVMREYYCIGRKPLKVQFPNSNASNTFRKGNISTACNTTVDSTTVAINANHPYLKCDDTVYIETVGTKIVRDHGGGLSLYQLDHWTSDGSCSGLTDLTSSNQVTYRLYR